MRSKTPASFLSPGGGTVKISKENAARTQLETAIDLWFKNGDIAATATLAYAGWQVVRQLNKKRGANSPLGNGENLSIPGVSDEKAKEAFYNLYSGGANYFKHSPTGGEEDIHYQPLITMLLLFDAVTIYRQWGLAKVPAFEVFLLWIAECGANIFPDEKYDEAQRIIALKVVGHPKKRLFYLSRMIVAKGLFRVLGHRKRN